MLTESEFASVYKPQDLYFFDPNGQVLVPDSVFVPPGTSPTQLVKNLVGALLNDPQTPWLDCRQDAPRRHRVSPPDTKVSVTLDGTTATVNLGGTAATATSTVLEQISAQLVWTLTGQQASPPIQAVQLEINGKPWIPPIPPCAAGARARVPRRSWPCTVL